NRRNARATWVVWSGKVNGLTMARQRGKKRKSDKDKTACEENCFRCHRSATSSNAKNKTVNPAKCFARRPLCQRTLSPKIAMAKKQRQKEWKIEKNIKTHPPWAPGEAEFVADLISPKTLEKERTVFPKHQEDSGTRN